MNEYYEDIVGLSAISDIKYDHLSNCVRTCAYMCSILGFKEASHADFFSHKEKSDKEVEDELGGRPGFEYARALLYHEGTDASHYRTSLRAGLDAVEQGVENPELRLLIARTIAKLVGTPGDSRFEIREDISLDSDQLLELATDQASQAIEQDDTNPENYYVKAAIHTERDQFDCAKTAIEESINLAYDQELEAVRYKNLRTEIHQAADRAEIQTEVEEAQSTIGDLEERYNKLSDQLESATDTYRTQVLQFLGFFAAIITVVITTTQVAINLSFPESAGLILVLIGGLLIAFDGFSILILPSSKIDNQFLLYAGVVLIVGIVTVVAGLVIGSGI